MISLGFMGLFRANTPQFIVAADEDDIVMDHEGATVTKPAPSGATSLSDDLVAFFAFDLG